MEKTAYAAVRISRETGKEIFLVNEISTDQESVMLKLHENKNEFFDKDYPFLRIAHVRIAEIDN